jgi:hypothetical protein
MLQELPTERTEIIAAEFQAVEAEAGVAIKGAAPRWQIPVTVNRLRRIPLEQIRVGKTIVEKAALLVWIGERGVILPVVQSIKLLQKFRVE